MEISSKTLDRLVHIARDSVDLYFSYISEKRKPEERLPSGGINFVDFSEEGLGLMAEEARRYAAERYPDRRLDVVHGGNGSHEDHWKVHVQGFNP